MVALLTAELEGRGRCLEIGVGTGLVALPLAEAGVPIVGVDISGPMLAKLVEKAGGRPPFPLVVGDATRLPFADGGFGAALLRHVLHLIPAWERAVAELARVVTRPGTVLVATGDIPTAWREVAYRFVEIVGRSSLTKGLDIGRELGRLDESFLTLGGAPRTLPAIPDRGGAVPRHVPRPDGGRPPLMDVGGGRTDAQEDHRRGARVGARALRHSRPARRSRRRHRVARLRPSLTSSRPAVGAGILWARRRRNRCRSRRSRRSGWTASWCRGTTPRSMSSPMLSITGAASSRGSGPTRPIEGPPSGTSTST